MRFIACGQIDILGAFACIECEAPLPGAGIAAQIGRACSEDCAADQSDRLAELNRRVHLNQRDLLCECAAYCAPAGLPTAEMRQEYADYQSASSPPSPGVET